MQSTIDVSRVSVNCLVLRLSGRWLVAQPRPDLSTVEAELDALAPGGSVQFDTDGLGGWDSSFLAFLIKLRQAVSARGVVLDLEGLPLGVKRLLNLADTIPERKGVRKEIKAESFLDKVGDEALTFGRSTMEMISFVGEASIAAVRLFRGTSPVRMGDFAHLLQDCGAAALPIISLISLLVGLILAYVGAVQLVLFGAEIYVANLVGIAMVRVMGAVMAGVIMAGRTGAAFAAQLGTMQVNEEIDALQTLGVSPMEFLVVPRILALSLMMPLLCLYADLMGILGGLLVGVLILDLGSLEYLRQTVAAVRLNDLWIGLVQSLIFGVLVAVAGCLRGLQCGRSASAVGQAATSAVVTGIISIVVATALVTVLCNILGI